MQVEAYPDTHGILRIIQTHSWYDARTDLVIYAAANAVWERGQSDKWFNPCHTKNRIDTLAQIHGRPC